MKKHKMIGIAVLVTAVLLAISSGIVFASSLEHGTLPGGPDDRDFTREGTFSGPMHGHGWGRDSDDEYPPMMSAMVDAVAAETGLTAAEIETRIGEGEHLYTIASEAGMSEEHYFDLMTEVREAYFVDVEEEGWMGSEHFQRMHEQMEDEWEETGFGPCRR